MPALQNVLHACGVDEDTLLSQARARCADWARWITGFASLWMKAPKYYSR